MTLRELAWAARARQECEWDRAAQLMTCMFASQGHRPPAVEVLNPYQRAKVPRRRPGPVGPEESALAWAAVNSFFQDARGR